MKPQDIPASDEQSSQAPARKPYQKPQLQIYGDLAEITKTVKSTKTDDGGHGAHNFTS